MMIRLMININVPIASLAVRAASQPSSHNWNHVHLPRFW